MSWRDTLSDNARAILETADMDTPSVERLEHIEGSLGAALAAAAAATVAVGAGEALATGASATSASTAAATSTTATSAAGGSAALATTVGGVGGGGVVIALISVVLGGGAIAYWSQDPSSVPPPSTSTSSSVGGESQEAEETNDIETRQVESTAESTTAESPTAESPTAESQVETDETVAPLEGSSLTENFSDHLEAIQRIEALVASDPAAALRAVEERTRRVSEDPFEPERELYRVEALVQLGEVDRARRLAERFDARFPESAYRIRIEELLSRHP